MRTLTTLTRNTRWLASRRALYLIALVSLAALMASPELKMTRPVKAASTWTVCASGCDYTTINAAISNASTLNGDTIMVSAGTYAENVILNKMLTLKGAQAGVNACGRSATESIIAPAAGIGLELRTGSAGSIIDGFTISGGTRGIESTSGPLNNLQIFNNRVVGFTGNGIFLNDPGTDITVNQNSIDGASKVGSGGLFHLDIDSFNGFNFTNNCVNGKGATDGSTGFFVDGNHNVSASATPRNPLISGNSITNCNTGMNLGTRAFGSLTVPNTGTISNNTFSNNNFDGLQGGIQNTLITGNTFSNNGRHGLALTSFGNMGADRGAQNSLVRGNLIIGNGFTQAGAGILFSSTQAAGTISTNRANFNRIVGNATGVSYSGTETIFVDNNWWGCNKGPGDNTGVGCMGTVNGLGGAGSANLDADPWLVLKLTAAPNSVFVGGTSNLTADLSGNSTAATFTPPETIPNGTPVAFAGMNGTVAPSNTSTTSGKANSTYTGTTSGAGSASTTVDMQTVSTPITVVPLPLPPVVKITDPAVCLGPGGVVGVSVTVTNNSGSTQTISVTATLPAQMPSLANSCSANAGSFTNCNGGTTVSWSGSLTAGQTATLTYQAQVADGTLPNTQLCINTTATFPGSAPLTVQACTTVNCPTVGPGAPPPAAAAVSDQKPGSVLFYNLYTSNPANLTAQNTRINITNTEPARSAVVHLFFVDGATCSPADVAICLTPNQTMSFLASDVDPGTTGYIVAVAVDPITGCPINFNFLIGDEFVKLATGHQANLGAEAFSALSNTLPPACTAGSLTATLNFDGISYNQVPRVLAVDNFPSVADGNNTLVILNRVGGSLLSGASSIGSLFGVLYDEAEQPLSFSLNSNACQFRFPLTNASLRTVPRVETMVGAGRTGWLRLWGVNDIGLLGAMINFNGTAGANNFNQGHNLHKLTFTSASLTVPIIPPNCQ